MRRNSLGVWGDHSTKVTGRLVQGQGERASRGVQAWTTQSRAAYPEERLGQT